MEDNVGIPEDLRCKRSDGKQWRCGALSMPDKTVCEKHYIQAKKRAVSSALRASLKKAKGKSMDDGDIYLDGRNQEMSLSPMNVSGGEYSGPSPIKKRKEKMGKSQSLYSPETTVAKGGTSSRVRFGEESQRDLMQIEDNQIKPAYSTPPMNKAMKRSGGSYPGEYSGESTDSSSEAEGLICHQCQRNDRRKVVWCMSCNRRGYCDICISRRYLDISMEGIRRVCAACRGICNCRACLNGNTLIKARIREIANIDKLQHLHSLLSFVLPVLKQIHSVQCFELEVETRVYGTKKDITRAKINPDEQMCCNFCRIPIFDYHRHCTNCFYDLCLSCCRDLRRAFLVGVKEASTEHPIAERSQDDATVPMNLEISEKIVGDEHLVPSTGNGIIDFARLFPKWKANSDGSIPCPPVEAGGCGCSSLILRRILKIDWVAKLVKNTEEMVNGCKISDFDSSDKFCFCAERMDSQASRSSDSKLYQCSHREDGSDNYLCYPALVDTRHESIGNFRKHWVKGEPIIVRHMLECVSTSSWDPTSIWRGIQDTADEKMQEDNIIVKAIDCLKQSEVGIELSQFVKGYTEGRVREDGTPEMLKLKDWPSPSAFEGFILCQRPEFFTKLPLLEYIHSQWGLLNLSAKLPHDSMQTDVGPKIFIAYGSHEELGSGDSVTNLQINMGDMAHLLMHTSEVKSQGREKTMIEKNQKIEDPDPNESLEGAYTAESYPMMNAMVESYDLAPDEHFKQIARGSGMSGKEDEIMEDQACNGIGAASVEKKVNSNKDFADVPGKAHSGAIWDVFRRQDVPKLNEYLRVHWKEIWNPASPPMELDARPVFDQDFFLSKDHKRILKERYKIEPWTFIQHVGEAVFVPAGCPFQVRNLQSSVQLGLDFLSPESLGESVHLAQEIRCLPTDHEAKLQMLEAGKMSLYAASSAIREINKITLNPKFCSDLKFEDRNLTAMVSENLERMSKGRRIACI